MPSTLVALLQDRPDALPRVIAVLDRRLCRVLSLSVGGSEHPGIQRVTCVFDGSDRSKVVAKLERLIDVVAVHDLSDVAGMERESVFVRVSANSADVRTTAKTAGAVAHMTGTGGP